MSAADMAKLTIKDNDNDRALIIEFVNFLFASEATLSAVIPMDASKKDSAANASKDGVLLAKLALLAKPNCFDISRLNTGAKKVGFQLNSNQAVVIEAIKELGLKGYEGLKPEDLLEPEENLILELIEKMLKLVVFGNVNQKTKPELVDLTTVTPQLVKEADAASEGKVKIAKKLTPEELAMRWFNLQLRVAGWTGGVITSLASIDLKAWAYFAHSFNPLKYPLVLEEDKISEYVLNTLKEEGICHFLNAQVLTEKNAHMIAFALAYALSKKPTFNSYYEKMCDTLLAVGDKKESELYFWISTLKGFHTEDIIAALKDGVSVFYLLDDATHKVQWKGINKGNLNMFKAQGNWKIFLESVKGLTRFPPQVEDSQLAGGDLPKIMECMDIVYKYHLTENFVKKYPEADVLNWANGLSGKSISSCAEADAAYLTALFAAMAPKLVDAGKASPEYVIRTAWKLGFPSLLAPSHIAEKNGPALHAFLATVKAIYTM